MINAFKKMSEMIYPMFISIVLYTYFAVNYDQLSGYFSYILYWLSLVMAILFGALFLVGFVGYITLSIRNKDK